MLGIFGMNPTRAALIHQLAQATQGHTSGELADQVGLPYQTVVGHLRALREAGIVTQTDDLRPLYALNRQALHGAWDEVAQYLDGTPHEG